MMVNPLRFNWPCSHAFRTLFAVLLVLSTCAGMSACYMGHTRIYDWPLQEGVVINKETGEPIAGAWVIGRWKGYNYDRTVCFHADATQTDAQGHFVFPAWRNREGNFENSAEQRLDTSGYAPGYQVAAGLVTPPNVNLTPFVGDRKARMEYLSSRVSGSSCDFGGESRKSLYPYYEALYLEAKSIAVLPDDVEKLQWIRLVAASQAISSDTSKSHDEYQKEREEFLRDHLK